MKFGNCTLSIDWEDFGQLYAKYHFGMETPPRGAIERQTEVILDLLDEAGKKATFFILGSLAKYRPDQVKKIAARGHEIGIHGYNHESMFNLSFNKSRNDIETALKIVSDIISAPIFGYRAPLFSVRKSNFYIFEILTELGLIYDSSVFPIKLPRYGISGFCDSATLYKLPNGNEIVEIPLSVVKVMGIKLPVSGGGYVRMMPEFFINYAYRKLSSAGKDSVIYMHPYEFDPKKIDVSSNYPENARNSKMTIFLLNLRWNFLRKSVKEKIRVVLKNQSFTTCLEKARYVKNQGICPKILGC